MRPKRHSRRTKIDVKNGDEKRRSRRSSWSRLGSILGRLGCRLGVKIVLSPSVALVFLKIDFLVKMRFKRRLGTIWGRFGSPKGVKMRAAEGQKRSYVEMSLSREVGVKLR